MKRTVVWAMVSLLAVSLLSGCIHLKEFTPEELNRISSVNTVQIIPDAGSAV